MNQSNYAQERAAAQRAREDILAREQRETMEEHGLLLWTTWTSTDDMIQRSCQED